MDAKTFFDAFGKAESRRVAEAAGTTYYYFRQIVLGQRNASFELAAKLHEASDGRLDQFKLMTATPERREKLVS